MGEITQLIDLARAGDQKAASDLLPLVYRELRDLAARKLAQEKPGHTLEPTALVHEAYLRLLGPDKANEAWDNCGHFFAAAAESMRRILVESARRKLRLKRGGNLQRVDMEESEIPFRPQAEEILRVDDVLERLQVEDSLAAQIVKLHFFAGLSIEKAGEALGMSRATAYRQWTYAKAWLRCAIDEAEFLPPAAITEKS